MQTVSVIGLGFVGLSTATVFASKGIRVIGVENNEDKFNKIVEGKPEFYEYGLKRMLRAVLESGLLTLSRDIPSAVRASNFSFITVGTPALSNGSADLSSIKKVALEIGRSLSSVLGYHIIIIKSTVPPGTSENVVAKCLVGKSKKTLNEDFGIASNPEFLKEGHAIKSSLHPHILVIGSSGIKTKKRMISLYKSIYGNLQPKLITTNVRTAELIKYANNAFLATKISFINTIANICARIPGSDVETIAEAIGSDPRIGSHYLHAGPGYGGSCLSKDVEGFVNFSKTIGYNPLMFKSVQKVNQNQLEEIINMVLDSLNGSVHGKVISILGLAFKQNTDDIRESVSLKLIRELIGRHALIKVHDPMAIDNTKKIFGNDIKYYTDKINCIKNSDCCVLMTEWEEYKKLTRATFRKYMRRQNIVDVRRLLDPSAMKGVAFKAVGLGKSYQ